MLKLSSLILLFLFASICFAQEQIIAGKNSPEYKIVLPDESIAEEFLLRTAVIMQDVIYKSTGSKLQIIHEKDAHNLRHGIYIGKTRKAIKTGINPENFNKWEYLIKSDGDNVYIVGREKSKGNWKLKHYRYYELGSCKGMVDFLKKYIGLQILQSDCVQYTGQEGVTPASEITIFEEHETLSIPSDLDIRVSPRFQYCIGRELSLSYRLANDMLLAPWIHSYGGHSHEKAIPTSLFESHPEYFAQIGGKRQLLPRPMFCLSNPEVQELIYKEMVKQLQHVDWVQLAQTDGFQPCQCTACQELYGMEKWSEKIWILHRNLAQRLMQEMPDKKVIILSYADTSKPPETFHSFPANTIIEICKNDRNTLEAWSKLDVPGGFAEYVYNWGYYHAAGFTPKVGVREVVDQIKLFAEFGVKGIYTCGFGELWGLEGPTYYAYAQAMKNPEQADPQQLLQKYCQTAFGPAAEDAEKFYEYLYERITVNLPEREDGYDYNKIDFTMPYGYDNYLLLTARYPANVTAKLNSLMAKIEQTVNQMDGPNRYKMLTEQLRIELTYLDFSAAFARSVVEYLNAPNRNNLVNVNSKLQARTAWLSQLPQQEDKAGEHQYKFYITPQGLKVLGGYKTDLIQTNGTWCGRFYYPLVWNIPQLLAREVYPGGREILAMRKDDSTPNPTQQLIPSNFYFENYKNQTDVRVNYDNKHLTATFICHNKGNEESIEKTFYLILKSPAMKLERSFEFKVSDKKARVYKATPGNPHNGISYDLISEDNETIVEVVKTQNSEDSEIVLKIPFDILGGTPKPNDSWSIGFVCIGNKAGEPNLVWEPDIKYLNGKKTQYLGRGKLIFK